MEAWSELAAALPIPVEGRDLLLVGSMQHPNLRTLAVVELMDALQILRDLEGLPNWQGQQAFQILGCQSWHSGHCWLWAMQH